jgi:hypothetical protein
VLGGGGRSGVNGATSGIANTGGGGAGAWTGSSSSAAGSGGSGIVIVRYPYNDGTYDGNTYTSATQFVYSGNVSATDLLHGLTPVTTGWNTSNNASPLDLNDGIHGAGFQVTPGHAVQGAWTTVGATAIYNLGTGPGGTGYDITSVQSIADWVSAGFGNQAWTIEVKPVGGSYTTLATVNYQPLGSGGAGNAWLWSGADRRDHRLCGWPRQLGQLPRHQPHRADRPWFWPA